MFYFILFLKINLFKRSLIDKLKNYVRNNNNKNLNSIYLEVLNNTMKKNLRSQFYLQGYLMELISNVKASNIKYLSKMISYNIGR